MTAKTTSITRILTKSFILPNVVLVMKETMRKQHPLQEYLLNPSDTAPPANNDRAIFTTYYTYQGLSTIYCNVIGRVENNNYTVLQLVHFDNYYNNDNVTIFTIHILYIVA